MTRDDCPGHETTRGAIGSTEYCDGSCRVTLKNEECEHCGEPFASLADWENHSCYGTRGDAAEARRSDDR